ncbi:MAG: hypothetical protein U9R58_01540, partial [Chloroflexota bacterium]|nr:hypothetical protein [Chloroflexota bacterium]
DVGPSMILIGGINDDDKSLEQLLEDFISGLEEGVEVSNQRDVMVDNLPGIMVDIEAIIEGKESLGRVVMVAVTPNQMFSMIGAAPPERMSGELEDIFNAVLASVSFFEPELELEAEVEPTSAPVVVVETPVKELIRQWAATAKASSQYSDPDWAAEQATGAPDTPDCGDLATAWASLEPDTIEWLEVGYDTPVIPTEVNIYESHTPSQVALVEMIDTEGSYHEVYNAVPEMKIDCPYVLSILIEDADYQVVGIKITVDQSVYELPWDEIDAVELVGYVEDAGEVAGQPPEPTEAAEPTQTTKGKQPTQPPSTTPVEAADVSGWAWTNYTSADGLADDMILSVAVAEDGTVWAGNFNVGVSRIVNGEITNYGTEDGLGYSNTNALAIEPDGSVWAGTTVGLGYFDGSDWKNYTQDDGLIYETVKSLLIAPDGTLWVGTSSGVSHYDGSTWTNYNKDDGLVDNSVGDIDIDEDGNLWFATLGGMSSFDGESWTSYTEEDGLAYKITTAIAAAPDGSLWVATSGNGVSRFDGSNWTTYAESDDYDLSYVKAIEVDQDGALWFATEGEGIYRYDGQNWLNIRKADGLPGNWVDAATVAPDGSLWFGFRREGVARFGP